MTPKLAIPKTSAELGEMLADPTRRREIFATAESTQQFIDDYAEQLQGEATDLHRQIADETQRQIAAYLREHAASGTLDVRRPDLNPQNRTKITRSSHQQGAAHNPNAPGAALDGEFTDISDYLRTIWHNNPRANADKLAALRNAAGSISPGDGGYLVPEVLRANLLQLSLEIGVVRPRATVIPMDSSRVPFPILDSTSNVSSVYGGMVGYWGEEGAAFTDSSPRFGRIELDAKKLTGFSAVPNELLADSLISFAALIETLWPKAIAFFEDKGFFAGSGVGEPLGFLGTNNPAMITVGAEAGQATATVVLQNIVKMYSRMLPASLGNAVWIISPDVIPQLFTMSLSVGTGGSAVFLLNAAADAPMTLLGRPIVVTEKANTVGTAGDINFVDLSYYLVGDRQQMSMSSSTDFLFGSDKTAFRISQRVDGRPWIKSPFTPMNGGPTLSPFVSLAARP
jgi:HK97 family phage major capsid protein